MENELNVEGETENERDRIPRPLCPFNAANDNIEWVRFASHRVMYNF